MKTEQKIKSRSFGVSAGLIILVCAILAFAFFLLVCGAEGNLDEKGHPANIFGLLWQGGYVIPIVITLLLTVLSLSVERFFALNRANGKSKNTNFVVKVKQRLDANDIEGASKLCDEQKGSVANIVNAGLVRYRDVEGIPEASNSEKAELIQHEIDEATTLELPYLEKNLNIVAAISTLGTLMGLFGTVLGMIRSFQAMGNEGAPDSSALAVGISEALLNTALGIATGALAIIFYTYFSGRIQTMTNAVDEIGFAIGQAFVKNHGGLAK
ncbi:MAG: MotA/TolQ/ExbB proton channel family protein [Dysgonamonadaceae bacterium]|jgi:biopolymer transport protein ExbB|nr:MotA/TolQ/ExbB proton channel family protein [Dysgonamonadaceae bacterium]